MINDQDLQERELTAEQRAFWAEIGFGPSEGEETLRFRVLSIRHCFRLEGLPLPSEAAILSEFERPNATAKT